MSLVLFLILLVMPGAFFGKACRKPVVQGAHFELE